MKKLRLELEELAVETFATIAEDGTGEGTVNAREAGTIGLCTTTRVPFCDSLTCVCGFAPRMGEP